ncbi:MAG: hypothetical protein PUE04_01180, partial [Lachnospira sp.]|nr:hypothetical protein [Lachnospira sp.]
SFGIIDSTKNQSHHQRSSTMSIVPSVSDNEQEISNSITRLHRVPQPEHVYAEENWKLQGSSATPVP